MSEDCAPCFVVLTIEIELPSNLTDELQDVMADDLTNELNLEQLKAAVKKWVRLYTGEACHVVLDVE